MNDKDALLLWMVKNGYWSNTCGDTIDEMLAELEFCLKEDRQCSSCGGFCKKSGCERENIKNEKAWAFVTEEEICDEWITAMQNTEGTRLPIPEFARAIEAKLKEKNT